MDYGIKFNDCAKNYQNEFLDAFCNMVDPELGIDLANLGLIYEVDLGDDGQCHVIMGLTTIGCPLVSELVSMVEDGLSELEPVNSTEVEVDYKRQWTLDRISKYAKIALGLM